MGPGSLTIPLKSWTPSLPSLKRTRSRKPPSRSRRVTLVNIETCNPFGLLACPCAAPVFTQLLLVRQCPLLDEACCHFRQRPVDHFACFDRDIRLVLGIDSMKVRWRMITNIHPDRDAIKPGNGR